MHHVSLPDNDRMQLKLENMDWDLSEDLGYPAVLQAVLSANAPKRFPSLQHLRHFAVSTSPQGEVVIYADSERADLFGINPPPCSSVCFPSSINDIPAPKLCVAFAAPRCRGNAARDMVALLLDELGSGFLPSRVETLVLQGPLLKTYPHDWRRILAAFPQLEYLQVNSDVPSPLSILAVFPLGRIDLAARNQTLCPLLGELILTCQGVDEPAWKTISIVLVVLLRERLNQDSRLNNPVSHCSTLLSNRRLTCWNLREPVSKPWLNI